MANLCNDVQVLAKYCENTNMPGGDWGLVEGVAAPRKMVERGPCAMATNIMEKQPWTTMPVWTRHWKRPRCVSSTRRGGVVKEAKVTSAPEALMASAVQITLDHFDAATLRQQATRAANGNVARRLLALALIAEGKSRRCRLAPDGRRIEGARKHQHRPSAAILPQTQSGRERLAIPTPELSRQPDIQFLQRHRRCLLQRLE